MLFRVRGEVEGGGPREVSEGVAFFHGREHSALCGIGLEGPSVYVHSVTPKPRYPRLAFRVVPAVVPTPGAWGPQLKDRIGDITPRSWNENSSRASLYIMVPYTFNVLFQSNSQLCSPAGAYGAGIGAKLFP